MNFHDDDEKELYRHTYENRVGNLCGAAAPSQEEHNLAVEEAEQAVTRHREALKAEQLDQLRRLRESL